METETGYMIIGVCFTISFIGNLISLLVFWKYSKGIKGNVDVLGDGTELYTALKEKE